MLSPPRARRRPRRRRARPRSSARRGRRRRHAGGRRPDAAAARRRRAGDRPDLRRGRWRRLALRRGGGARGSPSSCRGRPELRGARSRPLRPRRRALRRRRPRPRRDAGRRGPRLGLRPLQQRLRRVEAEARAAAAASGRVRRRPPGTGGATTASAPAAGDAAASGPDGCAIKGNVNARGERIYHTPSSPWYARVRIDAARGSAGSAPRKKPKPPAGARRLHRSPIQTTREASLPTGPLRHPSALSLCAASALTLPSGFGPLLGCPSPKTKTSRPRRPSAGRCPRRRRAGRRPCPRQARSRPAPPTTSPAAAVSGRRSSRRRHRRRPAPP